MEKLQEFIRYLLERNATGSIHRIATGPFFQKQRLAKYESLFRTGQYVILPEVKNNHQVLVNHLKAMGLNFFEGREKKAQQPAHQPAHRPNSFRKSADFILGGTDINYIAPTNVSQPSSLSHQPPHVLHQRHQPMQSRPPSQLHQSQNIVALMHVYNEADILPETIRHLIAQGVHVHVIDNWSTDGSWEIAGSFPETQLTKERFPAEGPTEHYEWFRQLEHSERLAKRLPYDWFLHYDADEFRYSPWPGVSLREAIGFVDRLGYNAIDFTVLDFRYTADHERVTSDFEANNPWFEFGKRPGHFLQVKGWKKQADQIDIKNSGGHDARFPGRKLYPVKFLTKHYSLRSREQAEKKLLAHRLPRVQKELNERSWHQHIDLLIVEQARGWEKSALIEWVASDFERDYLLERISGVGIRA